MEYWLNPLVSDPEGLPTLTQVGNDFSYDFNNVVAGLNYEIQISNDLVTWINPAFATLTSTSTTPVIIPASNEVNQKMFIRLRITE